MNAARKVRPTADVSAYVLHLARDVEEVLRCEHCGSSCMEPKTVREPDTRDYQGDTVAGFDCGNCGHFQTDAHRACIEGMFGKGYHV